MGINISLVFFEIWLNFGRTGDTDEKHQGLFTLGLQPSKRAALYGLCSCLNYTELVHYNKYMTSTGPGGQLG